MIAKNLKPVYRMQSMFKQITDTIASVLKMVLLTKYPLSCPLKPISKELVLLGNGPSLKLFLQEKGDFMKGKDLMMVNYAAVSEAFSLHKPRYYLLLDPAFFQKEENIGKIFIPLAEKTGWDMCLFVPYWAKKIKAWQQALKGNSHIKLIFFNPVPVEGFDSFCHFCFDRQWGMPRPRNVLVAGLMLGIRCGFSTIYMTGADHSWLRELWVDDENVVHTDSAHFYDKKGAVTQATSYDMFFWMNSFAIAFRSYKQVERYARKKGVEIYNVTPGSYIDAFRRKNV